jgi:hypothetical protein
MRTYVAACGAAGLEQTAARAWARGRRGEHAPPFTTAGARGGRRAAAPGRGTRRRSAAAVPSPRASARERSLGLRATNPKPARPRPRHPAIMGFEGILPASPLELPWAAELTDFWESVPLSVRLAGHSLFVAGLAPEFRSHWLVHYVVSAARRRAARPAPAAGPCPARRSAPGALAGPGPLQPPPLRARRPPPSVPADRGRPAPRAAARAADLLLGLRGRHAVVGPHHGARAQGGRCMRPPPTLPHASPAPAAVSCSPARLGAPEERTHPA